MPNNMAYEKQNWKGLPDTSTPITPERLNHIEDGIYQNSIKAEQLDARTYQNAVSGGATANMYTKIAIITSAEYEDSNAVFLINSGGWNNQSGIIFAHSYSNDDGTDHVAIAAVGNITTLVYGIANIVDNKRVVELFIRHSVRRFGGFNITCLTQRGDVVTQSGNTFQTNLPSGTQFTA